MNPLWRVFPQTDFWKRYFETLKEYFKKEFIIKKVLRAEMRFFNLDNSYADFVEDFKILEALN